MSIFCNFGWHKFKPVESSKQTEAEVFARVMEGMFPDSTEPVYDYVFNTLKNKYNSNEVLINERCERCGLIKHSTFTLYSHIVGDANKKVAEFEGIEKMKKVANDLKVSD